MINTKQVVPALVAVTLLSLAPAAEALAIEEHAQPPNLPLWLRISQRRPNPLKPRRIPKRTPRPT